MTVPGELDETTVAALREMYTVDQLVELTLKTLKFNSQKVNVTLGTHRWLTADDLAGARWNAGGGFVAADQPRP